MTLEAYYTPRVRRQYSRQMTQMLKRRHRDIRNDPHKKLKDISLRGFGSRKSDNPIYRFRCQIALYQSELARLLGVTTTTVARWERMTAAQLRDSLRESSRVALQSVARSYCYDFKDEF